MSVTRTFSLIKPDAMRQNHAGEIITAITQAGFRIAAMRLLRMSPEDAQKFYAIHQGKPFYSKLTEFMSSGPCIALVLEREDAVERYRELIGPTDPSTAAPGTIRRRFATSIRENAVHGADSDENARREWGFFFAELDMV